MSLDVGLLELFSVFQDMLNAFWPLVGLALALGLIALLLSLLVDKRRSHWRMWR